MHAREGLAAVRSPERGGAGGVSPDSPEGNGKARLIRSRPGILP